MYTTVSQSLTTLNIKFSTNLVTIINDTLNIVLTLRDDLTDTLG